MDNQEINNQENQSVNSLDLSESLLDWKIILISAGVVLVGLGSGYGLSRLRSSSAQVSSSTSTDVSQQPTGKKVKVGQTYGNQSEVFSDEAIGVVERVTDTEEGTHKLLREGGESQTAYLTSSLVDLDRFVNHKVKVWGETFAAQKVGWLMDVGAVKVLE